MYRSAIYLATLMFLTFHFACKPKVKRSIDYSLADIELTLEGPLFEGANEAQIELPFQPQQVLASAGAGRENLINVRIKEVALKAENLKNFDNFTSIVVQLVGGDAPLTSIALASPVPVNTARLHPGLAEKADLSMLRSADKLYLIIDSNLKETYEEDIVIKADITFTLDVNN